MRETLEMLTPFRLPGLATDVDILDKPRELLADAAERILSEDTLELEMSALLMADKYREVQALGERLPLSAKGSLASLNAYAFLLDGNDFCEKAKAERGDAPDPLFREAGEKYSEAVRIKPDYHTAFYNWGNALTAWANIESRGRSL